jgi:O-acetyl-ADP-ribose deacetylase (regulator of RNase III)
VLEHGSGDLLAADVDALVNTVNCVGVMGKGLALQFKRQYPDNYHQYRTACARNEVRLGQMFVVELDSMTGPKYIINFPTKDHWKAKSNLSDIESGLHDLVRVIAERGITSIAVPPLGAGNGGLAWSDVEPLIVNALDDLPGVRVVLYTPSNAVRHLAPNPIKMTWGRAATIRLIQEYVNRRLAAEPWESVSGASHLEIQKLLYFAGLHAPELKLKFEQGNYGPYSDQVRHLVQEMEAVYLTGFGDGTAPVQDLNPIEPTESGKSEANTCLVDTELGQEVDARILQPVLQTIAGFEGPYAIELLASTHWVATNQDCRTSREAWSAIQEWTPRKRRMFTEEHVQVAWDSLVKSGDIRSGSPHAEPAT